MVKLMFVGVFSFNARKFAYFGIITAMFSATLHDSPSMAASSESAAPVVVTIDRAKVLRISRPADTIIIGNPAIADATIQDSQTLILTGRSFGVTNIIILDEEGLPIVDETIVVQGHESNTVRIYRRSIRQTMACSPVCEPTLTIGDDSKTFSRANSQINSKNRLSDSSASSKVRP